MITLNLAHAQVVTQTHVVSRFQREKNCKCGPFETPCLNFVHVFAIARYSQWHQDLGKNDYTCPKKKALLGVSININVERKHIKLA
jgi:hypothetical protein